MKCQHLFSLKNKKNIINLLSAKFAHRLVKVLDRAAEDFMREIINDIMQCFRIFFIKAYIVGTQYNH